MGAIWAHDLPGLFQAAGLQVHYWPGWELRSRSSGGFNRVMAIGIHHDAGGAHMPILSRLQYAWGSAPDEPIGNMWIHTDGAVYFGAAGATNTQGTQLDKVDKPVLTSKGAIPFKQGNLYMFSIEMSNDGIGQVWTQAQLETLEKVLVIGCQHFGLDPLTDIVSHWRYTARKVDPRGPTPARPTWGGYTGLTKWNDFAVGASVHQATLPPLTPPEVDMKIVKYTNGFGDTYLLWTGTQLSWIENGQTYAWAAQGLEIKPIDAFTLQGLINGTEQTSPKPWTLDGTFAWVDSSL